MGHSHSSSHKRLKSISSTRNCGEFTEVVDLEFSDAGTMTDPSKNMNKLTIEDKLKLDSVYKEKEENVATLQVQYPKELLLLEEHVTEIEKSLENMSSDEFFVYFPTLKDDLHNCWQKVYSIRDCNSETKLKKYKVIDNIRELLRKLNARLQKRDFR